MERKLIGRVGVDSGQLMIIDPINIEGQWKTKHNAEITGVQFWGEGQNDVARILIERDYNVMQKEDYVGYINITNEIEGENLCQEIDSIAKKIDKIVFSSILKNSTFQDVVELTTSAKQAGALPYNMGHEGLAVAFSSGFGDGKYDVYATYEDFGEGYRIDKRISKVEIILIED